MQTDDRKYRITGRSIHASRWQYTGGICLTKKQAIRHAAKANRVHAEKSIQKKQQVFAVVDEAGQVIWK